MNNIGNIIGRGVLCLGACIVLSIAPAGGIRAEESEFIPGDDRIIEKDILRRIREELGQDIVREKPEATKEKTANRAAGQPKQAEGIRAVTLSLKAGRKIAGRVVLSQEAVGVKPDDNVGEILVPMSEIQRVEFLEWKARKVRVLPRATPAETTQKTPAEQASAPESVNSENSRVRIYFMPTRCRVVKTDETAIEGRCNSMDWLQFNMGGAPGAEHFRTYYIEERSVSEQNAAELERTLETLKGKVPVDTVISVELGGFAREAGTGTARRDG